MAGSLRSVPRLRGVTDDDHFAAVCANANMLAALLRR